MSGCAVFMRIFFICVWHSFLKVTINNGNVEKIVYNFLTFQKQEEKYVSGNGTRRNESEKNAGHDEQLGIEMIDIDNAEQVIIQTTDGDIIISNPSISIMRAQGVDTYQINGDVKKVPKKLVIPAEDIRLVCEQTGASEEAARKVLEENNGDLAEAILALSL